MVQARMAAALVKRTRLEPLPSEVEGVVERAYVELFQLGESWADCTPEPRPASPVAEWLVQNTNFEMIRGRRVLNQNWMAKQLMDKREVTILEPEPGLLEKQRTPLLALPVFCADREAIRRRLAGHGIYCAIHWADGDWSGQGGEAATWAAHVLSIPIDQRYEPEDLRRISEVLE